MQNIEEILQWIGLNENESKIYLALLSLWKSWVTNISKKSWVKRTTIYNYINPLLQKNFIKRSVSWKRILFVAENPKNLLKIFEERKNKFLSKLPLLEWIYKENITKTNLEFYEWIDSLKKLYRKIWSSWKDIYTFFSPEMFYKYFTEEFDSSLTQKYWKTRTLIKDNFTAKKHIKNNPKSEIKLLPKDFEIDVDIIITWNSIIMISFEPMYAVKLKNKALANFHKNVFKYFWKR